MSTPSSRPDSMPSSEDVDWTARRADARRNHELILAAARAVFAERGVDGTIPEIAARAGVGKATVYRSYPTKEALLEAVAADHAAWVDVRVEEAIADPDAFAGLRDFVVDTFGRLADDALLLRVLGDTHRGKGRRPAFLDELIGLVERGKQQGALRADATVADIQILVGGCARALLDAQVTDPEVWRHYANLTVDALRNRV
ncbi:helix-turn-helix domain-containing protein [Gordonia sp. ABSL1-1]|uniref:TetR/AcrR family transcriptional regulator n=1 Tax=Gordonia sp. ABSL1-1 TaxID=3053923 RepID=UPI0025739740|nr:TetR/AcrR family transcriptional regulator [Gordonia sp. ABSL1-1]MDL9937048.1 helix-turn-helix domain-containing protein [Gordonia sp. ABSL1-1]